jgi:hypothetical protein
MLIFPYRFNAKTKYIFSYKHLRKLCILMSPQEIMISCKNIKFREYNYNSYGDICVF